MKIGTYGPLPVTVDPKDNFEGIPTDRLMGACGLLPDFAVELSYSKPEDLAEATKILNSIYGFSMGPMEGGTVAEDWTYEYPEDPPMTPMMVLHVTPTLDMAIYQYALVCLRDTETKETYFTRMD